NDEARQLLGRNPLPCIEFGVMRVEVDVRVATQKAHGKPFLALTAIAPAPEAAGDVGRHPVAEPARALGDDLRFVGADLFVELAHRGLPRGLALVDAALRHLPIVAGDVDAAPDEDAVRAVEQHDADAGAIALDAQNLGVLAHFCAPFCPLAPASALAGASTNPF